MKKLVLFVEGDGDKVAMPVLVKKLLRGNTNEYNIVVDTNSWRVGEVEGLTTNDYLKWKNFLRASGKQPGVGGVLLVLDGDRDVIAGRKFCPATEARALCKAAIGIGAGRTFSVAVVFALQEYETWLMAGVSSLAGKSLPGGRAIKRGATAPPGNLEESPRDAKGWLAKNLEGGYKETRDQAAVTELVCIDAIRSRDLRSFRRLERALSMLVQAMCGGTQIVSPQ